VTGHLQTITLIRHAPTADNVGCVITGQIDTVLSLQGRTLAAAFVDQNGHLEADFLVSSPLRRATETASILFNLDPETVVTNELCIERDYGLMGGASRAEVAAMKVSYLKVGGIEHSLDPPGGETFQELRERADSFLELLLRASAERIACVTHQVFLQQLHGALRGLDPVESLAIDIHPLGIDTYTLRDRTVVDYSETFPGAEHIVSW
jgi:broad specificity phosphatase PhoE